MPKLPSDYEAHRSGGHWFNFEHLEFNVHLNPNKWAFLQFQTNSQTNLWIANNRANSGIQGITLRSITKTRRDSNCDKHTSFSHVLLYRICANLLITWQICKRILTAIWLVANSCLQEKETKDSLEKPFTYPYNARTTSHSTRTQSRQYNSSNILQVVILQ